MQAQQEYRGDAQQKYDIAFHKKAANRRLTKWANIDSLLWNRAFSGKSNDSAFCKLCLDTTDTNLSVLYIQWGQPNAADLILKQMVARPFASTGTGEVVFTIPAAELTCVQQSVVAETTATQTAQNKDNHPVNPKHQPLKSNGTTSHTVHTPLNVTVLTPNYVHIPI